MEEYLLIIQSNDVNLFELSKMVAKQRKCNLVVLTEKNTNELLNLKNRGIHCPMNTLMVRHRVLKGNRVFGRDEIIKFLREQQFKIPY